MTWRDGRERTRSQARTRTQAANPPERLAVRAKWLTIYVWLTTIL